MTIILPGVPDGTFVRFTCSGCGCVFDASLDEVRETPKIYRLGDHPKFYEVECPDCGATLMR